MARRQTPSRVGDRDEFDLIAALHSVLPAEPRWVHVGRGQDDAAVLDIGGRNWLVWTCDALVDGVHFQRDWLTPRQLGRRAASVNLSDLAAMGAQPLAALVSLHLPPTYTEPDYRQLMRGLGEQLDAYGASVVGGNLTRSSRFSIDVSLLGRAHGRHVARRRGAQDGDRVLVTGQPGEAAAGLHALRRHKPPRPVPRHLHKRWIAPTPRVRAGELLMGMGATALIDISDGLQSDLLHICRASRVGCEIDRDALPLSSALQRYASQVQQAPWDWILRGGEDYELLCTLPAGRVATARTLLRDTDGLALTDIGCVLPRGSGTWLRSGNKRQRFAQGGHRHFGKGSRK